MDKLKLANSYFEQEQVPATTTNIVLRNLQPDTAYTVSVLPVYPATEGRRQSDNGKTCEFRVFVSPQFS